MSLTRRFPWVQNLFPVILLTAAVFAPGLSSQFVHLDDPQLVHGNTLVTSFSPRIFWSYDPELYIPLTFLTYQIEYALVGATPFLFHFTNLLLHIFNVAFVFWFFLQFFERRVTAAFAAALFAVHPQNVEAVLWVSARKDLLAGFFFLLSLNMYVACAGRKSKMLAGSLISFFLGLLSKVSVVMLPLVLILTDYLQGRRVTIRTFTSKWLYFMLSLLFGIVALFGKSQHLERLHPWELLLMSAKALVFTAYKFLLPLRLSVMYTQTGDISLLSPDFAAAVAVVIACGAGLAFAYRVNKQHVVFGGLFFLLCFLPSVATFTKSGGLYFASDRYAYIPCVGLLFIGVHLAATHLSWRAALSAATLVLVAFVPLSLQRTTVWHDSGRLFADMLSKYPGSFVAHNNAGLMYMDNGQMETAFEHFSEAIRLNPSYADAHVNMGVWYARQGKYDLAEQSLKQALLLEPDHMQAYFNLAGVYMKRGETQRAIDTYRKTLELDPSYAPAQRQLQRLIGG